MKKLQQVFTTVSENPRVNLGFDVPSILITDMPQDMTGQSVELSKKIVKS